jgi:hypothetical protein
MSLTRRLLLALINLLRVVLPMPGRPMGTMKNLEKFMLEGVSRLEKSWRSRSKVSFAMNSELSSTKSLFKISAHFENK